VVDLTWKPGNGGPSGLSSAFRQQPLHGPFGDTGAAIERLLAAGVSRRDLRFVLRHAAYEAVFGTLYSLSDPGAEDDDVGTLYEGLLSADPSGMEGRPGSADAVRH
jgi:hypothetical protein